MNRTVARMAGCFLILVSGTAEPLLAQQQAPEPPASPQQTPASPSTIQPPIELPDNPGSTSTQPTSTTPAQTTPQKPASQEQGQQPSGPAVAPPVEVSGGAASKPAGVAIAPPKQRQIRSLLIKLGFLAGAGVAIGTVVGLSAASPGHVPNSPGH
jgi:hypothetical protein